MDADGDASKPPPDTTAELAAIEAPKKKSSGSQLRHGLRGAFSRKASRTDRWYAIEFCLNQMKTFTWVVGIIFFVIMVPVAFSGRPYDMPTKLFWFLAVTAIVGLSRPALSTIKRTYLKYNQVDGSPLFRKKDVPKTVMISSVCVGLALYLNIFSRGNFGLFPAGDWDYQRFVMIWSYWLGSFFLMHMYGILLGYFLLLVLFTGCCFGCCCNCCCRGPFFAYRRLASKEAKNASRARKDRRRIEKQRTLKLKQIKEGLITAIEETAEGAKMQLGTLGEVDVTALIQGDDLAASSKAEPDPIIDFVENKVQIWWLHPLIFVFAFVIGSALVMAGSALIGPSDTLPRVATEPIAIRALCKSPVTSALLQTMEVNLGRKIAYTGISLAWQQMLEPPNDLCEDIEVPSNRRFTYTIDA